jgi:hypothetical protein
MITFQVETWAECVEDMRPLWPLHWQEIAIDQEQFEADMDEERYRGMEQAGILLINTARVDGRLVGYVLSFLMPHFHYKSSGLIAMTDMYFVLPEYRNGLGAMLFLSTEAAYRERGVKRSHTSCKVHFDHEPLFTRLGWRFTDKTFSKLL